MHRSTRPWLALPLVAVLGMHCDSSVPPHDTDTAGRTRETERFARNWPRSGPPRLWSRELGAGYSGIVAAEDRLYTMYREDSDEVVICLDAHSGETIWEYQYESTPVAGQDTEYGEGPNAAPLLSRDRVYTIGFAGVLHCLDAATGEALWSRDLVAELGGSAVELGYSASPVEYDDTIIALVGGRGHAIVAFDRGNGRVVWKNLDFEVSYASPAILSIVGEEQLVAFMARELIGADPDTGELLWRYAIQNQYPQNICAPIQIDEDLVFVSTGEAGSRGLRIVSDRGFRVEEVWSTTRVQCFYGAFALVGDIIYGTSGFQSGPRMTAIDARTGAIGWRSRGFNLAHVLAVDRDLVILDDEGKLTMATPGPDGLDVHGEAWILSSPALTPPTLQGTILYARDQHRIVSLDLGMLP